MESCADAHHDGTQTRQASVGRGGAPAAAIATPGHRTARAKPGATSEGVAVMLGDSTETLPPWAALCRQCLPQVLDISPQDLAPLLLGVMAHGFVLDAQVAVVVGGAQELHHPAVVNVALV